MYSFSDIATDSPPVITRENGILFTTCLGLRTTGSGSAGGQGRGQGGSWSSGDASMGCGRRRQLRYQHHGRPVFASASRRCSLAVAPMGPGFVARSIS